MRFETFAFGRIAADGKTYEHDLVLPTSEAIDELGGVREDTNTILRVMC